MEINTGTKYNPETSTVKVGDFLSRLLVTDTIVYVVVSTTAKSVKLARAVDGDRKFNDELVDQGPFPVTYTEQLAPAADAPTETLRLRKDGTLRFHTSGHGLYPTPKLEGVPVRRTDYRF